MIGLSARFRNWKKTPRQSSLSPRGSSFRPVENTGAKGCWEVLWEGPSLILEVVLSDAWSVQKGLWAAGPDHLDPCVCSEQGKKTHWERRFEVEKRKSPQLTLANSTHFAFWKTWSPKASSKKVPNKFPASSKPSPLRRACGGLGFVAMKGGLEAFVEGLPLVLVLPRNPIRSVEVLQESFLKVNVSP